MPAKMGTNTSYLTSVSLGWIAANVYFSRDLPIFKKHRLAGSNTIDINDTTAIYLQQRAPDYSRQLPMAMSCNPGAPQVPTLAAGGLSGLGI